MISDWETALQLEKKAHRFDVLFKNYPGKNQVSQVVYSAFSSFKIEEATWSTTSSLS